MKPSSRLPSLLAALLLLSAVGPGCTPTTADDDDSAGDDDDDATGDDDDATGDDDDSEGCGDSTNGWSPASDEFERQVLELVNDRRAGPANCGTQGSFPAVPALTYDLCLRDAARLHAEDMAILGYFSHDSQDGRSMADRVNAQGYQWSAIGENIAAGSPDPESVVQGWMDSDGHCANIMNATFTELGVGYYYDSSAEWRHYWVQNFGRP